MIKIFLFRSNLNNWVILSFIVKNKIELYFCADKTMTKIRHIKYLQITMRIKSYLLLLFFSIFSLNIWAQVEGDPNEGKKLFSANCASCHNKNMKDRMTGPALGGTLERWADYPQEDLYRWIRFSSEMIAEKHPRATELWSEWSPTVMSNFPNLSDDQIGHILAYINGVYEGTYGAKVAGPTVPGAPGVQDTGADNTLLFTSLFIILGILAIVLMRIVANLNHMVQVREGTAPAKRKTLVDILTSRGVIGFLIFVLIVLGGYTTVDNAIDLGRQQGYAPEQPIKFYHSVHSGIHKIECQYCHDGARRSKHSVIPAANTCMNCHAAIKKGSLFGTEEITKIFASIGFDPNTDQYIPNYDEMSEEDIAAIFKRWIKTDYIENAEGDANKVAREAEEEAEDQWSAIKASLTNEQKKKVQGPIEWIRIHNLPDHAYFNHAQHVTVGKIQCQQCHGPVEEMEVVEQYSPLSMGWCVNCHRMTEVEFLSNDYYDNYERYHEEMATGKREKVTVEEIGGIECQKCHY